VAIDRDRALEKVLSTGDEWQSWRALRLDGDGGPEPPRIPAQDDEGGFVGPEGMASPGSTGEALCHLVVLGLGDSGPAAIAADWLESRRTPALAWLDSPLDVPGELDDPGGARVWATAAAACGLLAAGRDPGPRAAALLSGEAATDGHFTGGAYPTFAAAGVYWQSAGPKSEMAEWALRWARETQEEWWQGWEHASALTFWAAAGVPAEHPTVDAFAEALREEAPPDGWPGDAGLTLRALELFSFYGM
jgi:hypothetical protein